MNLALCIIPVAVLLDLTIGDPRFRHHPIRWMGRAIIFAEPHFRKIPANPVLSGGLFALSLVFSTWCVAEIVSISAGALHSSFRICTEIVLIYFCVSAKSLKSAAMEVYELLRSKDLPGARANLAFIVGRDVEGLSEAGVVRASVETVAENLVDGVISPLFYAAIGGAPLALAYKMVNTLDSMVGYKNETYLEFGKVAAKTDDIANFIPARISVAIIAISSQILARKGVRAFETAMKEGANHSSPNAGYPEAAFAGALGARLGGPNRYGGALVPKPFIGSNFGDPGTEQIRKACDLMILSSLLWTGLASIVYPVARFVF